MNLQKASLFVSIALALSAGANLAYPQEFVQVTTGLLAKIAVGGQSMWGINRSGQIYQFEPAAQTFRQVPGQLTSIAVGGGPWDNWTRSGESTRPTRSSVSTLKTCRPQDCLSKYRDP